MTEINFPYKQEGYQLESTNWQLSPAINFLFLDHGHSSLHFYWERHNTFQAAAGGKLKFTDIKDSIKEISTAIESLKKLFKDKKIIPPKSLGINTPNLLFRKLFPSEYMVERYGVVMFDIDIQAYMEQNKLDDVGAAWSHFLESKILSRLASIQQRIVRLEQK